MSMSLSFQAFTTDDIAAMRNDHTLVDDWVSEENRAVIAIDIADAWDVLNKILTGTGFESDEFLDDVLFNGCELIDAETVKLYSAELSDWNHERLLRGLRDFSPVNEAYHIESFRAHEQYLLIEFDKLVAFYREAASKNLAVLHYAA